MVAIPILSDIIKEVGSTIREAIPDPDKRRELEVRLAGLDQSLQLAQIDVNKTEAQHSSVFVAGWRPFIGWVSGVALGYTWIVAPLAKWTLELNHITASMPALEPEAIYPVIMAMLGIGSMRTFEKVRGVAYGLPTTSEAPTPVPPKKKGKWL